MDIFDLIGDLISVNNVDIRELNVTVVQVEAES